MNDKIKKQLKQVASISRHISLAQKLLDKATKEHEKEMKRICNEPR